MGILQVERTERKTKLNSQDNVWQDYLEENVHFMYIL